MKVLNLLLRLIILLLQNFPISSYPTLENCLFEAVHLTQSNDIDKYKYSGYGTGFDRKGKFSVDDEFGRNCIIFGVGMSSSVNLDNKKKSLHLGAGPTQGLDGTALTAEKMCSINFTKNNKIFV